MIMHADFPISPIIHFLPSRSATAPRVPVPSKKSAAIPPSGQEVVNILSKRESDERNEELTIELENYILLSPDALPLDKQDRENIEKVIREDPLSLIEYWSVDPDYDSKTFRSKWQDYRENHADTYKVDRRTVLIVPKILGIRKVCVRAADVFGFESITTKEVF